MRRIRKFHSDLGCLETYWHSVQNTYIFYVGRKFTDSFVFHVITCFGVILLDRLVINGIYFYIVCGGQFYNNT